MIYKTLRDFTGNPTMEYQRRNGVWYKRKQGDKTDFYQVDAGGQNVLDNYYKGRSSFSYYNTPVLAVGGIIIGVGLFWIYKKAASYGTTGK